ncbi:hypothetical protein BV898_19675 [Hypsibius exemplaris]|uniref:Uncharacterized protein n=1 Tax=Hypsibius exemplaris TaxID=2072580 RepID=A0A9X6NK39_HYPEX|nr:hypothetical protein BV898_19675 [Hypsibius exemplaris]
MPSIFKICCIMTRVFKAFGVNTPGEGLVAGLESKSSAERRIAVRNSLGEEHCPEAAIPSSHRVFGAPTQCRARGSVVGNKKGGKDGLLWDNQVEQGYREGRLVPFRSGNSGRAADGSCPVNRVHWYGVEVNIVAPDVLVFVWDVVGVSVADFLQHVQIWMLKLLLRGWVMRD